VGRKPIVQYVVEELVANGIDQILFVTGRNKSSIENHFDSDPELTRTLQNTNKLDLMQGGQLRRPARQFLLHPPAHAKRVGRRRGCGRNFAATTLRPRPRDSIIGLHANPAAWPA